MLPVALRDSAAVVRLRDPSARFASLGMTRQTYFAGGVGFRFG